MQTHLSVTAVSDRVDDDGPTGSGKSSTLAAISNLINETRTDHIHQRELHNRYADLRGGAEGGAAAGAKSHPGGRMRDRETIEIALTAAMTAIETSRVVSVRAASARFCPLPAASCQLPANWWPADLP